MKCQNEARRPRVHYAAPQIGAPLNRLRSVPAPSISRRAAPAGTRSGNEIRFNEPDGLISARKKTRRLHKFLDTTALDDLLGIAEGKINDTRLYRCLDRILPHKTKL